MFRIRYAGHIDRNFIPPRLPVPSPDDLAAMSNDGHAAILMRLTNPPHWLSMADAIAALKDGTAETILAAGRRSREQHAADFRAQLQRLMSTAKTAPLVLKPDLTPEQRATLIEDVEEQYRGTSTQTSEPNRRARYFVCTKCNAAFGIRADGDHVVCPCGSAHASYSGSLDPLREIPVVSGTITEITDLIDCGKVSVVSLSSTEPHLLLLAIHNRPKRNVQQDKPADDDRPELTAEERRNLAIHATKVTVTPPADYLAAAAARGARVTWLSHYHVRSSGIDHSPSGDYLRKEATGDARFVGEVIVRDMVNEADGSILFVPVHNCARCGTIHRNPLAFWKLKRPVIEFGPGMKREITATHFAFCPVLGEPIMMVSSEVTPDADLTFSKPAPPGTVEGSVNPISGNEPISGPTPAPLTNVGGIACGGVYNDGYLAGNRNSSHTNPHVPTDSPDHVEWQRGYDQGQHDFRNQ